MTVRKPLPYLLAFVLGLAAAALAACGAKENPAMIPAANAQELKADLGAVLAAVDSRNCGDADRAIRQARSDLLALPAGTSKRLRARLQEGVDRLARQAADECQQRTTDTTATETTATDTTPPAPEPAPTVPTATTPPPPTTTVHTTPPATQTTQTAPPVSTVPPGDTGGAGAP